jgi:diguanylate cyclase (GGDEF)-like protein
VSTPDHTSVLILSADPRDQHVIFDSLDECGFEAIYSAQSLEQAREQMDQIPVNLLIADLSLGADEVDLLRQTTDVTYAIALARGKGAAKRIDWDDVPDGFDECVRSPVDPDELWFRLNRLLDDTGLKGSDPPASRRIAVLSSHGDVPDAGLTQLTAAVGRELSLACISVVTRQRDSDILNLMASWTPTGEPESLDEVVAWAPVGEVLNGRPVIYRNSAPRRVKGQKQSLDCLVGLPLRATDGALKGGIFAGAINEPADWETALALMEVVGWRVGDQLEIRRLLKESRVRGLQDSLTLLPNRLLFKDRLAHALNQARRTGEMFALMFVDLDRFKSINDSLGHNVGDDVLLGVAERLRENVRKSDTVARYAGDEFTIIVRHVVQKEDVLRTGEKLIQVLSTPITVEGDQELSITASIGISFFPDDGETAELLLKRADMAMYNAKGTGRNNCQHYVRHEEESHQQRVLLESKLRLAEANDQLRVFYQPQLSTEPEDIVGMEALIRWEHPELGLISPGFFVPLAEESGLIVSMGEWLLRTACNEARSWQEKFGIPLTLGVNLSPMQLRQPELVSIIEDALSTSGLAPSQLDLEVTENLSIKNIPGLRDTLTQLRTMGCSISIDDFGTGQSSLDYLKRFPADRIKIDQTFVRNIGLDPDDEAIVRATIDMAHQLNMEVVAEGVELEEHLEFLCHHDCDQVQGFLFCRPITAELFGRMLAERAKLTASQASGSSKRTRPG